MSDEGDNKSGNGSVAPAPLPSAIVAVPATAAAEAQPFGQPTIVPGSGPLALPQMPPGFEFQYAQIRASRGVMTDPQSIGEYERSVQGSGIKILEKFFEEAGKESDHRREMEKVAITAEIADNGRHMDQGDRAQRFALVIVLCALALAAFCAHKGQFVIAGGIVTAAFSGVVATFIYGRKKQTEEAVAAAKSDSTESVSATAEKGRSERPLTPVPKS